MSYRRCIASPKVRYPTRKSAEAALLTIRMKAARERWRDDDWVRREARAYRCPRCRGYHLTSRA